jgi:hypothetical protein
VKKEETGMGRGFLAALAAIGGAILLTAGLIRAPLPKEAAPPTDAAPVEERYWIKSYRGRLAVFHGDPSVPETVYGEVAVAALPPDEQERLARGIAVEDPATLRRLLEDYTS